FSSRRHLFVDVAAWGWRSGASRDGVPKRSLGTRVVAKRRCLFQQDHPMAYRLTLLFASMILTSAAMSQQFGSPPELSAERIKAAVEFLASDRLEGRGPGTRGEELTTEYLAAEFKKAGLKPFGERGGGYFQGVPLVRVVTSPKSKLQAIMGNTTVDIPCE